MALTIVSQPNILMCWHQKDESREARRSLNIEAEHHLLKINVYAKNLRMHNIYFGYCIDLPWCLIKFSLVFHTRMLCYVLLFIHQNLLLFRRSFYPPGFSPSSSTIHFENIQENLQETHPKST